MTEKKDKKFKREGQHKQTSIPEGWRKPRGNHSKSRRKLKDAPAMPNPGYRTDKELRGLHPSGYEDVLVNRPQDLDELDPETDAARIASSVGGRKKKQMVEKADELGIHVLNAGDEE